MKFVLTLLSVIVMPLFVLGQDIMEVENNTNGIIFPRMSAQPTTPVQGQCFFNTTLGRLECFNGNWWVSSGPGATGATGAAGADGADGATGATGPQGPKGDTGATGAPGVVTGGGLACWDLNGNGSPDVGSEDTNGDNVVNIFDCIGAAGATGAAGIDGANGANGATGATGATGAAGTANLPLLSVQPSAPTNNTLYLIEGLSGEPQLWWHQASGVWFQL